MYQIKSRILGNEEVAEGYFRLSLECSEVAGNAVPGQFVMIRVGDSYDPLLRRPFSIHRINKGSGVRGQGPGERPGIEILYKVIGKGTGTMVHVKTGEEMDLIGPLGKGFSFGPELKKALIVGGGIGAAPLLALTEELRNREKDVTVFLGGRTKSDILCVNEFKQVDAEVKIATDDGSLGHKGFVTELLEGHLGQPQGTAPTRLTVHGSQLFNCGPHLMSKKVAEISRKNNIPCQVSLEAHMACGIGACLGCVIKVHSRGGVTPPLLENPPPSPPLQKGGLREDLGCGCDSDYVPCETQFPEISYKRVCVEGPVFDAEEVVWE